MFYIIIVFLAGLIFSFYSRKLTTFSTSLPNLLVFTSRNLVLPLILSFFLNYYPLAFYINFKYWFQFPLMGILFQLTFFAIFYSLSWIKKRFPSKKILTRQGKFYNFLTLLIATLLSFLGILLPATTFWGMAHFQHLTIPQVVYHLTGSMEGADTGQITSFLQNALTPTIFIWLFLVVMVKFILSSSHKIKRKNSKSTTHFSLAVKRLIVVGFSFLLLIGGSILSLSQFGFGNVYRYFFEKSELYEKYYVEPEDVSIVFPEKKRNLIYIFVESLETTYYLEELGGGNKENIMSNLTGLASENGAINFSHTKQLGGAFQLPGVGFTLGGMVAQTAGIPVITQINANQYAEENAKFLSGAISLGDILAKEGYKQTLLLGSDAKFAGRDSYFKDHGNYQIIDYPTFIAEKRIPEDYYVWWGIEDKQLFSFAKEEVTKLAENEEPFNFTMLTADTHFPDGYLDEENPYEFDSQYKNVVAFSDEMIGNFIYWLKEQPFYENTTVIISGDHLNMGGDYFDELGTQYYRTVTNLILNSPLQPQKEKEREFSTMDFYPTTLAALNAKIKGEQLGLGTNLFSDKKTLTEELGFDYLKEQIPMRSDYYEKQIVN